MANHGGKRKGAGRPRLTTAQLIADGLMPIDYLADIMRDDKKDDHVRIDAAKAICPYLYPKLSSVVLQADGEIELIHKIETTFVSASNTGS